MLAQKKIDRIELLKQIGNEVFQEAKKKHAEDNGDPREIVFNEDRLPALVEDYATYLEAYRARHNKSDSPLDGDKISALTGTLIMRHRIFTSETKHVSTLAAGSVNEVFAVRMTLLFLSRYKWKLPPPELSYLTYCFSECHHDDQAMMSWTVATMTAHKSGSNIKEPTYQD